LSPSPQKTNMKKPERPPTSGIFIFEYNFREMENKNRFPFVTKKTNDELSCTHLFYIPTNELLPLFLKKRTKKKNKKSLPRILHTRKNCKNVQSDNVPKAKTLPSLYLISLCHNNNNTSVLSLLVIRISFYR
jgi:hypothetical protein